MRIDEARDDDLAGHVVDLGAGGDFDFVFGADVENFPLEDDHDALLDDGAGRRMNARAAIDDGRVRVWRLSRLDKRVGDEPGDAGQKDSAQEYGEHSHWGGRQPARTKHEILSLSQQSAK